MVDQQPEPNDQRKRPLVNSKLLSDVSFIVGQKGTQIYSHRYPLLLASDVFYRMFSGDLAPVKGEPIEVPDIEPDAFLEMLKFIYYDNPAIREDNLVKVYYAAEKYNLGGLISLCLKFVKHEEGSVLKIFAANMEYEFEGLYRACLQTIYENPLKIFKNPEFLELPQALVEKIASQVKLRCNDDQLLEALKRWSEHQKVKVIDLPGTPAKLSKLTTIVEQKQEHQRDYHCRKWRMFGKMVDTNIKAVDFQVKALKPLDLYGVGLYVGKRDAKENPASLDATFLSFSILITGKDNKTVELWNAKAPFQQDIYIYDCMFERYSLQTNDAVTLSFNNTDYYTSSICMETQNLSFSGDSSIMSVALLSRSSYTNCAYILYQTK